MHSGAGPMWAFIAAMERSYILRVSKRNLATCEQAVLGQKLGQRCRSLKMGERGLGSQGVGLQFEEMLGQITESH